MEVWDKDVGTPDDYIGSVVIRLAERKVGFAQCNTCVDSRCKYNPYSSIFLPTRLSGWYVASTRFYPYRKIQ